MTHPFIHTGDAGMSAAADAISMVSDTYNVEQPQRKTRAVDTGTKYIKSIRSSLDNSPAIRVDIYDVLTAFNVTCPARQHAIKKIIFAGSRGSKSAEMDLNEAGNSIKRAKELL